MSPLILNIAVALIPVFLFLVALMYLDSYKLVGRQAILLCIAAGCLAAGAGWFINDRLIAAYQIDFTFYTRYEAPVIEELLKASYLLFLLWVGRVGFAVDAAISGFAIGAGFALVENIAYLGSMEEPNLAVWIVRGFGTAVMHGGSTALVGMIAKSLSDVRDSRNPLFLVPGFVLAIALHSLFNHFILSPMTATVLIVVTVPVLMVVAFARSERATRAWLGVGFDNDAELLTMIISGNIATTRVGLYLESIRHRFRGEVLADLLCYLRMYLELAIQSKGILMMREAGFESPPDPDLDAKMAEMKYLERSIGKTGLLALKPFIHTRSRDLWQLQMLH